MSPSWNPASSAGDPGSIAETITPFRFSISKCFATSGVMSCTVKPSPLVRSGPPERLAVSHSISAMVTGIVVSFPSRTTFTSTFFPGLVVATTWGSSCSSATIFPLYSTITSPDRIPAFSAGPSLVTSATSAPFLPATCSDSAISGVSRWM